MIFVDRSWKGNDLSIFDMYINKPKARILPAVCDELCLYVLSSTDCKSTNLNYYHWFRELISFDMSEHYFEIWKCVPLFLYMFWY